jgi:alkanesulfonate monooxygenase SsuD/methylene tetrahydromethanopterin reductase-like flavin-dependent oxidoreductase (luciferase family)/hemerythrin-like domain-containing protein
MTDYGHDLLFGAFLTPAAAQPERVVALAQLAEQLDLDLATFQDHPYQPAFLDTWTLMSYVAAATERIRLTANVLNLPLRPPAVLARSAASLDLLSGGRIELGLGAGAFWDAIEASGGRRLSPGQAVVALDEAIQVIRSIWDADQRGGVRVDGDYYQVLGAKRGPAPAHEIGIWLGAYKPRMLELTGRAADGWLPSLGYLPGGPSDLTELNRLIDEGAVAAGRAPQAVRRMLNITGQFRAGGAGLLAGPVKQWVDELAGISLEYGISGFILGSDDPQDLQTFALEVAPAVRELVAAERTRPSTSTIDARIDVQKPVETKVAVAVPKRSALGVTPTADSGVRLSDPVWDESTRPSSPAAPEGHVYSSTAQAVGQHLIDVHDHLRSELDQLRDILRQVKQGTLGAGPARSAINEMTMRQNDWTLGAYCATYCRTVTTHHSLEDAQIFPHLRQVDTGLAPVIDRLEAEHLVIHDVLENVDRALVDFVRTPDDFTGLQKALDQLTDALLSHLAYEEQQIVEPLARFGFYPGQV